MLWNIIAFAYAEKNDTIELFLNLTSFAGFDLFFWPWLWQSAWVWQIWYHCKQWYRELLCGPILFLGAYFQSLKSTYGLKTRAREEFEPVKQQLNYKVGLDTYWQTCIPSGFCTISAQFWKLELDTVMLLVFFIQHTGIPAAFHNAMIALTRCFY